MLVKKIKNVQEMEKKVSWYLPNEGNHSWLSHWWSKEGFQRVLRKAVPPWSSVHRSWTSDRCWQEDFSHDWKQAFWLSFMVIHCQMVNTCSTDQGKAGDLMSSLFSHLGSPNGVVLMVGKNHTTGIWRLAVTLLSDSWIATTTSVKARSACRLCGLEIQAKKCCRFHTKNFLTHLTTVKAKN